MEGYLNRRGLDCFNGKLIAVFWHEAFWVCRFKLGNYAFFELFKVARQREFCKSRIYSYIVVGREPDNAHFSKFGIGHNDGIV